jgi:multimeric flavodoxin WrbA
METRATRRVLGIMGSPRRNGNTDTLVDEVLRGAEEAGAIVDKVTLVDLDLHGCLGCDSCRPGGTHSGECVQQDDMPALLKRMAESDIWVLGTPVYWWGPSAQFKTFLDRWYVGPAEILAGHRVVLVVPMGDTEPTTGRHTIGMIVDSLEYSKSELFATVLATGVNERGEVRRRVSIMQEAYQAGAAAVAQPWSPDEV